MSFLDSIGLPEIIAGIMVLALNAYALSGGADFGGGVWDLLARGPRRDAQRAQISRSIAPIWEANHVWLIVVVVLLFSAFPAAFQDLAIVLHIPLTIMLVGIVLRGSAFVFRSYGSPSETQRNGWGMTFAIASTITPVVLGMMIGALVSGDVGEAARRVASGGATFGEVFLAPWLGVFPFTVGLFALALFSFLAAVYLAYAAGDEGLRDDFRRRAFVSGIAVFVLAAVVLVSSRASAPTIARGVTGAAWALPLHALTAVAATAALVFLRRRRYGRARIAAAAQVTFILWGWVLSQYPYVIPNGATIDDAASPRRTLELLLAGLAIGFAILIPALRYLFRLFDVKGRPTS